MIDRTPFARRRTGIMSAPFPTGLVGTTSVDVLGLLLHRNWLAAYRAAADFLARKLVNRERMTSEGGR